MISTHIQYADADGHDIRRLDDSCTLDCDIHAQKNDFELTIYKNREDPLTSGNIIYIPGTEIGGLIEEISNKSSKTTTVWEGYTWRGLLTQQVLKPPSGSDYLVVSGDLNTILRGWLNSRWGGLIIVPDGDCGKSVTSFQVDRHATVYDVVDDLMDETGYRLDIQYINDTPGVGAHVEMRFVAPSDYSNMELTRDYGIDFTFHRNRRGTNHIIGGGKGELKDRTIVEYYADEAGNISTTQTLFGRNEREYFFDYSSAEDTATLRKATKDKLKELCNSDYAEQDPDSIDLNLFPGDKIGGRDYETGLFTSAAIDSYVAKFSAGGLKREYKIAT